MPQRREWIGPLLEVRLTKGTRTRFLSVRPANKECTSWMIDSQLFIDSLQEIVAAVDRCHAEIAAARADGWRVYRRDGHGVAARWTKERPGEINLFDDREVDDDEEL